MELSSEVRIYTITELNSEIHDLLESALPPLWLEGEISNCRAYPSGHTYLTLKDENSQLSAVLFKGAAQQVRFKLEDGLKVLARARVSSYVARGSLQLVLMEVQPRDKGALQLAFEQLKEKLAKEGLFDASRKKTLPKYPKKIGLITSLQGAVLHDILSVIGRRWPCLEILIHPVKVQGDGAKEEIVAALQNFNAHFPETDVLLVGRGGGSLEDLWAFNEEVVARAIAASTIPVISCVGHETDTTIADFVADVRAPTPSVAAELAVPDRREVLARIRELEAGLVSNLTEKIQNLEQRLGYLKTRPVLESPHRLYEQLVRRVDEISARLPEAIRRVLLHAEKDLRLQIEKLDAFSPLKVLGRGYAIAEKMPGREILRSVRQVGPGDIIRVRLHEGQIDCEVKHVQDG